jgi:hypothetical protein
MDRGSGQGSSRLKIFHRARRWSALVMERGEGLMSC